jgi:hypothetical protein
VEAIEQRTGYSIESYSLNLHGRPRP